MWNGSGVPCSMTKPFFMYKIYTEYNLKSILSEKYEKLLKLIIATIIYWGTITVFFISIIPIYRLFTIYKGRVNNKVW